MDVFLSITAFLCCLVGIVGCIVPVLPGPVLSYAGLFCAYACSYSTLTPAEMWLWAGLTAAVTAADYFLPGTWPNCSAAHGPEWSAPRWA